MAGSSPAFTVDSVTDLTPAEDTASRARSAGTITVPCYLTNGCAPGGRFSFDGSGLPRRMGTMAAKFYCNIPRSALDPASPPKARPSLYGHGLLGNATEIDADNVKSMSNEHNFVFCATDWAGFAEQDLPHIVSVLSDFSGFNTMADRMQQGFLNMLFLGRAMIHPQGLVVEPGLPEGRPERARHHAAVLRRQQPGRHHGRRPDRRRARLRPRGARRAGHELLHAAPAKRGLRHLRGDHLSQLHQGRSTASSGSPRSSCCGTAARRTATRTT